MSATTPLLAQYRDIKSQHPDAILFFRMGDFYEMFYDDAQIAARVLSITLTARGDGVPLAGVPVKAAAGYLRQFIAAGHRVAICEQVEDPKLAKGIVKRASNVAYGRIPPRRWKRRLGTAHDPRMRRVDSALREVGVWGAWAPHKRVFRPAAPSR